MLGHYGRDEGLFTIAEGIRRMTSLPATRFGLRSRGEIREGYFADLVVLDAGAYAATSTYLDPHQYAGGVDTVLVNGRVVLSAGRVTEERPGRRLRRGHR
jgi:N-acyl-D-aspartate/D-glutamate deacylase